MRKLELAQTPFKFATQVTCHFCDPKKQLPNVIKEEIREHLILTKNEHNHIHVHGSINNKVLMKEFILAIAKESGIEIED